MDNKVQLMLRRDKFRKAQRERIRQALLAAEHSEEDYSSSESSLSIDPVGHSTSESSLSIDPVEELPSFHSHLHISVSKSEEMEEVDAAALASLRKKLERLLNKAGRTRESLARKKDMETPDTIDVGVFTDMQATLLKQRTEYEALSAQLYDGETNPTAMEEDETKADEWEKTMEAAMKDCALLLSQGTIHSSISSLEVEIKALTAAYELQPDNDHSTAVADVVTASRQLKADMKKSLMPREEELRGQGEHILERAAAIQGRVAGTKAPDAKPSVASAGKSHLKLKYVEVPNFSGRTEDWLGFSRLFQQAVHSNPDLNEASKLNYLLQALQDPRVKHDFSERMDEPGAYTKFMAELEATHDKPRWMHRRYVERLRKMESHPRTREGLMLFLSEGQAINNGLLRLKGGDISRILTSTMEAAMDPSTRALWNQKTTTTKVTPDVEDLFTFLKNEADQLDESAAKGDKVRQRQLPKHKGSVNSVSSAPPYQGHHTNATPYHNQNRGSKPRQNQQPSHYANDRPTSTLACYLCQGPHTMFYCATFGGLTVPERKEKVVALKLCLNCLKPNHMAKECNSSFRCRVQGCGLKHNSLLHEERSGPPPPQVSTQHANAATHIDSDEEDEECLLMTARVSLIGSNNEIVTVRALLDSGSTLSICTDRLARQLKLQKTGKQVAIKGIKSKDSSKLHPMRRVTLASEFQQDWRAEVKLASMPEVIRELPLQHAPHLKSMPHLRQLRLADNQFDRPGKIELLLGQNIYRHLFKGRMIKGPRREDPEAWLTVFGWTVLGSYKPSQSASHQDKITHFVASVEADDASNAILARFQELEEPSVFTIPLTAAENRVEEHYQKTHTYDATTKQYTVSLPKVEEPPELGESKTQAKNRARANEQSLIRKGKYEPFQLVMKEYLTLGHAIEVTGQQPHPQNSSSVYYMPIHSVVKECSTTTRVRAVFDASAKTSNHVSLNDTLAVGPTLHPTIDKILLRFRKYPVAISSDITKMYREVLLDPKDQPLHRFIWRETPTEGWKEFQMTRVTFGVAASPYLAVKTLQQAGVDHGEEHPEAQWQILNSFYVDDLLGGASTEEAATALYHQLTHILEQANFHLRKWRSSHPKVLQAIPTAIQEAMPTQELVDQHSATYPKALGVTWDSSKDTMFTNIELPHNYQTTKRGVISDVARTFDVLGWISPAILPMKLLYRDLWKEGAEWDEQVSAEQASCQKKWREELPLLKEIHMRRCYFRQEAPSSIQLHGYSDASDKAYAAVIFIRATYPTSPPTVNLVISKTKVSPLATRTTPQLELCGANLLARLMATTRQTLGVPMDQVWAYTDSTVVLGWLGGESGRYCVFSGHRIASTILLVPYKHWNHVPTDENPADAASRGMTASELKDHKLWWHGPEWLSSDPVVFPRQPTAAHLAKDREQEMKPDHKTVMAVVTAPFFEQKLLSYSKLVRVTCYMMRFIRRAKDHDQEVSSHLHVAEGQRATKLLLHRSQLRSFPDELSAIAHQKNLSPRSKTLILHPFIGKDDLLRVGGRLWLTKYVYHTQHPVILSAKDHLTSILFRHYHLLLGHCGPSTLLTHAANLFHVIGGRTLARTTCQQCIVCRKKAAKASSQLIGQLPPARVEPHHVFLHTGMDFCGPFNVRQGYTRKPVEIKVYLAIFICFATKAIHLEVVSDLKTGAFLAALDRFVARRGLPLHLYSDNGSNYTGARNQLAQFYKWLSTNQVQDAIQSYVFQFQVTWHNSPERAPHFGGLWEAAVKSAKFHLKRIVGQERLTFEELSTITCNIESFLNSRPLGPVTSHDIDGLTPLTPSHFLIGRAARAYPQEGVRGKPTTLQRWSICKKATQDFWDRWSQEYLQQLQKATRWHKPTRNYQVGDLVMLTDGNEFKCQWSMAKVIKVYPGVDGYVRAVDIQVETKILPTKYTSKDDLAAKIKTRTSIFRRPITKLALLLAMDDVPGDQANLDNPVLPPQQQ